MCSSRGGHGIKTDFLKISLVSKFQNQKVDSENRKNRSIFPTVNYPNFGSNFKVTFGIFHFDVQDPTLYSLPGTPLSLVRTCLSIQWIYRLNATSSHQQQNLRKSGSAPSMQVDRSLFNKMTSMSTNGAPPAAKAPDNSLLQRLGAMSTDDQAPAINGPQPEAGPSVPGRAWPIVG